MSRIRLVRARSVLSRDDAMTIDSILFQRTLETMLDASTRALVSVARIEQILSRLPDERDLLGARESAQWLREYIEKSRLRGMHFSRNFRRLCREYLGPTTCSIVDHSRALRSWISRIRSAGILIADMEELHGLGEHVNDQWHTSEIARSNFNSYLDLTSAAHRARLRSMSTKSCPVSLLDVALSEARAHRSLARARGIELHCEEGELAALPHVSAEAHVIGVIAANLLCNAINYGAPSSTIVLRGAKSLDGMLSGVLVENRGRGMKAAALRCMFERGYRGARVTTITPGAGLGLFVVKGLVELYGGRVEITSTPLDGSDFLTRAIVLFPAFADRTPSPIRAMSARSAPGRHGRRLRSGERTSSHAKTQTIDAILLRRTLDTILDALPRTTATATQIAQILSNTPEGTAQSNEIRQFMADEVRRADELNANMEEVRPYCMYFSQKCQRLEHDYFRGPVGMILTSLNIVRNAAGEMRSAGLSLRELEELIDMSERLKEMLRRWHNYLNLTISVIDERGIEDRLLLPSQPANLLDAALNAIREHRALAGARAIEILCEEATLAALPDVSADGRIGSVIASLLCNAINYGTSSSTIMIRGARTVDGKLYGVRVENRGLGIETAELSRVFECGYRGPRAARVAPGAGLGLFIVERFVELCGGRVEIASTPIDGDDFSTTVTVLLPPFVSPNPSAPTGRG